MRKFKKKMMREAQSNQNKTVVTRSLRIFHGNIANGLANKMSSLRDMINFHNPDIIFINESEVKINKFESLDFFNVKGYDLLLPKTSFERQSVNCELCEKRLKHKMN